MRPDINILNIFKSATGGDMKSFLEDFALFCNQYYSNIVDYYQGNVEFTVVGEAFNRLDDLMNRARILEPLFTLKSSSFSTIDAWELLDIFTDCQTKLWTIDNSAKWLRSAVIGRYGNNVALSRVLKTRENFESVASSIGSSDSQNEWVDIARNNSVEEEDYTADEGGGMFRINLKQFGTFEISNIVDTLETKNILGKDIDKNFSINGNDICTVEYEKAIFQSLDTITQALKGCIPEFPEYGIPNESIGSSTNALKYPSLFRHVMNMFQRDARWSEVTLLDLYRKEDNVFMKIQAKTVTNNFLTTNIQI